MNTVKGFFDSFKEFIWDIIGYLLPGSYIIILLSICVDKNFFVSPLVGTKSNDFYPYVFIIASYLLGYVSYGFGWFKEQALGKYSYIKTTEQNVSKRKAFLLSKELISKALLAKGVTDDLSNATVRDLRSIAMSFIPDQDQKIYTFTFRSELSNQAGNISVIVGFLGLVFSLFKGLPFHIFKSDTKYLVFYLCLLLCYFFLRYTRNRFYAISIGLPFSIYTANAIKP